MLISIEKSWRIIAGFTPQHILICAEFRAIRGSVFDRSRDTVFHPVYVI